MTASTDIFRMCLMIDLVSPLHFSLIQQPDFKFTREGAFSSSPWEVSSDTGPHFCIVNWYIVSDCRGTSVKFVSCLLPFSFKVFFFFLKKATGLSTHAQASKLTKCELL